MNLLYLLLLSVLMIACTGPPIQDKVHNLDFEMTTPDRVLPTGWSQLGSEGFTLGVDSSTAAHSGNRSLYITRGEIDQSAEFGAAVYILPGRYAGDSITLSGWLRTRNITENMAALLLRIDGPEGPIQFGNSFDQPTATTQSEWMYRQLTLPYSRDAQAIAVGGILQGPGEAWFDDFTVTIDGHPIEELTPRPQPSYPAAQDTAFAAGSRMKFPAITPEAIDKLTVLGRVWGFLKYHHPAVAAGQHNFDAELFRVLPDYLAAGTQVESETVLRNWIERLGPVAPCDPCAEPAENPVRTVPLTALTDLLMDESLVKQLGHIYRNRNAGEHYYVGMAPGVGDPDFRHEEAYDTMTLPDAGYRLLALYRYWNMIYYFFPYVEETDRDWEEVLPTYIAPLLKFDNHAEYEYTLLRLIGEINDTHAQLAGSERIDHARGNRYAAVHLRHLAAGFTVADYYNDELRDTTALEVGDVITHIDGRPVEKLVAEWRPNYPASNDAAQRRDMASNLLRSQEKQLEVTVMRINRPLNLSVPLFPQGELDQYWGPAPRTRPALELLDGNIGYVSLQNITEQDVKMLPDTFAKVKGLIVDIRNYPATFVPFSLGGWLLKEDTPFVKFTHGSISNPGTFEWTEPLEIPAAERHYPGKVIVLVNENTQSQAEYTAMALRAAPRTTIVGSTTAGADGNFSSIFLPGGLSSGISGIGIFYPNGTPTQRVGIVPDVYLMPTPDDLRAGRDVVLQRAIKLIEGTSP